MNVQNGFKESFVDGGSGAIVAVKGGAGVTAAKAVAKERFETKLNNDAQSCSASNSSVESFKRRQIIEVINSERGDTLSNKI